MLAVGAHADTALAAEYTSPLKGTYNNDRKVLTDGSKVTQSQGGKLLNYNLVGDNTFTTAEEQPFNFKYTGKTITINAGDGKNTIYLNTTDSGDNTSGVSAFSVTAGNTVTVNGNLNMTAFSQGYSASGISTDKGTGTGAKTDITINGNVTMRRDNADSPWAMTTKYLDGNVGKFWPEALGYKGARWAPAALSFGAGSGSTADFNGDVDLAVRGTGVSTDPFYGKTGMSDYDLITVNMNGGNITIETPEDQENSFLAIANYGGTINVNVKDGTAGTHDVVLKGNVLTMENYNGSGEDKFYRSGLTNIGLTTKKSLWQGVIDNSGAEQAGKVNVWLTNGAVWDHQSRSLINSMDSGRMPHPSNEGHYGTYDGISHVNDFQGGDSRRTAGFIYQNSASGLQIENFSGFATIVYDHENSGATVSDYTKGDVTVKKAASGSELTLSTSSKNIDMSDQSAVQSVLSALAQKLIYSEYTSGVTNLTGKVQIASGLLSTDTAFYVGDIVFDKSTGKGNTADNVVETVERFTEVIDGEPKEGSQYSDYYKDGTYTFASSAEITSTNGDPAFNLSTDKTAMEAEGKLSFIVTGTSKNTPIGALNQTSGTSDFTAKKIYIERTNEDSEGWAVGISAGSLGGSQSPTMKFHGNTEIKAQGNKVVQGIYAQGKAQVYIDGDLKVDVNNTGSAYPGPLMHYATNAVYAGASDSSVTVSGHVDITTNGTGIHADAGSTIDIKGGGSIVLTPSETADQYAIVAEGSTVNMNAQDVSTVTANGDVAVNIKGNLGVVNKEWGTAPTASSSPSVINLELTTRDSSWEGIAFNEFGEQALKGNPANQTGEINLRITNGAMWTNASWGAAKSVDAANEGDSSDGTKWGYSFTGSKVAKLYGGSDAAHAGYIIQKDSHDLTIDNMSGHMVIVYDHDNDGSGENDYTAGQTIIKNAAAGSGIIASTSSKNIDTKDNQAVENALARLAKKFMYLGKAEQPELRLQVASGLLNTDKGILIGQGEWGADKLGDLIKGTLEKVDNSITVDNTESYLMQGVRSAVTAGTLSFRDTSSDLLHQTEFIKSGKLEDGIWAKTYGGKSRYDGAGLDTSYSYWGSQVGYDKDMENGWHAGLGLDYQSGSSDYLLGGTGDNKLYTLGVYVNKDMGDGAYFDAAVKVGHVENDFHVYNEIHEKLSGRYSTNGYSASARIGKRIGGDSYIEPSLQFTYAHLQNADFEANSEELGTLYVSQDAYDSLVGRVGLEIGNQNPSGGFYGKVSIAHEFKGDVSGTYSDGEGGVKRTSFGTSGTWSELTLGGQYQVNEDTSIYADLTRSLGGDYQTQWKANAGVRVFLGSGVTPGAKKTAVPVLPVYQPATDKAADAKPSLAKAVPAQAATSISSVALNGHTDRSDVTIRQTPANVQTPAPLYESRETAMPAAPSYDAPQNRDLPMFTLDAVVVTANRVPQPILEARADISVVNRKEIEDMHMGSVEEVLRTVPGVQFLNYGGNGINANLSGIRLNGSKDVVLLVDGVRVNDFQGVNNGGYMYASLLNNVDNIERVEVLRGAAGTLYGSAAKGGVINIITRKVNGTKSTIDVSRGTFGKQAYKLNTQGRIDQFSYNLYYDRSKTGDFKAGDGVKWAGKNDMESFGGKFAYDFKEGNTLTVNYDSITSDFNGYDRVYEGNYRGGYENKAITLQHAWKISDLWHNTFSYRNTNTKSWYDGVDPQNTTTGRTDSKPNRYEYNLVSEQAVYTSDKHTLSFGFDYSKAKNKDLDPTSKIHYSLTNLSLYAQDDWKILPSVTLTGGIRHDRPDNNVGEVDFASHTSHSYKVSWDVTDKDTVYAGRSDYFILPGMDQLTMKNFGNKKLQPAEGRTTSIGYNRQFSDKHILTVNWFQTDTNRGIGYDVNGKYTNYASGTARGWNAQWTAQFNDNWSARFGWAHLFQYESGDSNYAMGYYPKDLATFSIYYTRDKWTAAFDGYYFMRKVNPKYADEKGWPKDNYGVYNLSATYSPNKNLTFYGKIENLFDVLYAEHTNVIHPGGQPGDWYSMPGRSFLLGMQMKF